METLDKHFRELTRAAFARHGFVHGEIAARWAEIAGAELSRVSEPQRIKWPRGQGESAQKTGGTLMVRAAPGRGLELQYHIPAIIERINRYYGYGAIAQVKIVQSGTWPCAEPPAAPAATEKIVSEQELADIEDDRLKAALARLGAAVAAATQTSPQGK